MYVILLFSLFASPLWLKNLVFLWLHFQVMWLVDIFRAKIVDISDHSLTIEVILLTVHYVTMSFLAVYLLYLLF